MIALVLCLLLAGSTSARQVLQVETDGATANVITGFDEGAVLVQSGCVMPDSAYIWYRCPVAYPEGVLSLAADAELSSAVDTPELSAVTNETDYTNTVMVESLQPATKYYYQVTCSSEEGEVTSVVASFKTAPTPDTPASVSFVWLADMAGQGWGQSKNASFIDFEGEEIQGGYLFASTALKMQPDFAVLQGDMIYADNVISPTKEMPEDLGGGLWYNDNTKDFSAITLDDFRMNWKYNLGDARWRAFLEQTPVFVQWDDHEVVNNWYPTEVHAQEPYLGLTSEDLFAPAWQSLFEYNPIMGDRLYKKVSYGSHLDIFIVDYRTYRDVNPKNNQSELVQMMGEEQFEWFTSELSQSNATWKLISNHDPFSIVTGGENDWDAWSAGNDEIQGRELQLQAILELIQQENICNVHAFSADVHYASAIFYDPEQAAGGFTDFKPFYEFVIGPIHAGAFGPNAILDASFGPTYEFVYGPGTEGFVNVNLPPPVVASMGHMQIDGATGALTVTIMQTNGEPLYTRTFEPEVCA